MKQLTRMTTLAVFLLAGASAPALAKGPETAPPEPVRYEPPPPPPAAKPLPPPPPPVVKECESGPYISLAAGIGIPSKVSVEGNRYELDNALVLNGALGYDFGSARLEAAAGYQKHDASDEDGDISFLTVMGNAYYDIDTGSDITPYVMAGAGMAHVDMTDMDTENVFAWQVGAGLGISVTDCVTFDIGYRYLKPTDFETPAGDGKMHMNNILAGIRMNF